MPYLEHGTGGQYRALDETARFLETTIKYEDWIPVRSPGLQFYCDEVVSGKPFSLVRYGEGEWRSLHPDMQVKKNHIYSEWREEDVQERLRDTLVNYHEHPRYWPAIWHQRAYAKDKRLDQVRRFIEQHGLEEIKWHDGRVWRRAIENRRIFPWVSALRHAQLPVIIVGPREIAGVSKHIDVHAFIPIHRTHAYYDIEDIKATIKERLPGEGATICFSAGGTACILIHDLFLELGESCYLVDCGAFWEAMVGMKTRPYHKELRAADVQNLWQGKNR